MNVLLNFIAQYWIPYLWMLFTTFINIIAPFSGAIAVNPVTAYFTDPQRAIGISLFVFFFTGIHRVYLFRNELISNKDNAKTLKTILPFSILGAIGGSFLISYVNQQVLAIAIIAASVFFIYKTVVQITKGISEKKKSRGLGLAFVMASSGFLQGSGMPGSDLRNNYLRTFLSELSVRAVGSVIGPVNFFVGGTILFLHNKLENSDFIFILALVPLLVIVQAFGKKVLEKMEDRHAKILAISLSVPGIVLLALKYFV